MFWSKLNTLFDYLELLAVILLVAALAFSLGYHTGFISGLDTKVTIVKESTSNGKGAKR